MLYFTGLGMLAQRKGFAPLRLLSKPFPTSRSLPLLGITGIGTLYVVVEVAQPLVVAVRGEKEVVLVMLMAQEVCRKTGLSLGFRSWELQFIF